MTLTAPRLSRPAGWSRRALVALGLIALLGGAMALRAAMFTAESATITLDPTLRSQTISGWEVVAQAGQEDSPAFPAYRDALFDQAVNDLGINRVRLEVRSGVENARDYWQEVRAGTLDAGQWRGLRYATANDNDDPFTIDLDGFHFTDMDLAVESVVLPLKQRVEARGERFFLNVNYVAFTRQIAPGHSYAHADPEEYAEFVLATALHLRDKYGLVPDGWEVILEPDNTDEWSGQVIGQAIVAAGQRLEASGFTPHFIAPSTTSMWRATAYFDEMVQVPGVLRYLGEISYHRYIDVADIHLQGIAARAVEYGLDTAMLEHIGSGYEDLHQDLKVGRVSAWQQFALAYPTTDNAAQLYLIDDRDPTRPVITPAAQTRFLRHYFRFIRPGAVRIGAMTTDARFDPLAFLNADGRAVVVVKAASGGEWLVRGLPPGTYALTYTTAGATAVALPDQRIGAGAALHAAIPEVGVMTIVARAPPAARALPPTTTAAPPTVTRLTPSPTATRPVPTRTPRALALAPSPSPGCLRDVNGNGIVDSADILAVAARLGCVEALSTVLRRWQQSWPIPTTAPP